jgi:hypothetical protein
MRGYDYYNGEYIDNSRSFITSFKYYEKLMMKEGFYDGKGNFIIETLNTAKTTPPRLNEIPGGDVYNKNSTKNDSSKTAIVVAVVAFGALVMASSLMEQGSTVMTVVSVTAALVFVVAGITCLRGSGRNN